MVSAPRKASEAPVLKLNVLREGKLGCSSEKSKELQIHFSEHSGTRRYGSKPRPEAQPGGPSYSRGWGGGHPQALSGLQFEASLGRQRDAVPK